MAELRVVRMCFTRGNISRYFVKSVEVFLFFLALIVADCDELHYCMSQN